MDTRSLKLEDGLAIQQEQLAHWKQRLNPVAYEALLNEAAKMNEELIEGATGFNVWRGDSMYGFIMNWKAPADIPEFGILHIGDVTQAIHCFSD